MKIDLHDLPLSIFEICLKNGITIEAQWVPKEQNSRADYLIQILDYEDWVVADEFFVLLAVYGAPTILTDLQVSKIQN